MGLQTGAVPMLHLMSGYYAKCRQDSCFEAVPMLHLMSGYYTSLLRAYATTMMVRSTTSATTVIIGRRFRTTRTMVAT